MNIKNSFHPYAMITIFFWSLAYAFTKLALQYFSPFSLGCLRYIAASAALIVVVAVKKIKPPKWKDMPYFIISGASGFFLYMVTFNVASQSVNASTGSVIVATTPIITALLARVIYKEKLRLVQYCAIGVSFLGVVVLTALSGGISVNVGIVYLIGAALCLSVYNIAQRKITKKYSPLCSSAYSIFWGTLMLCIFLSQSIVELSAAPAIQLFNVAVLGFLSSAAAYCAWAKAIALAENVSSVSNYMFVTPFITTIIAMILVGETLDMSTVVGGIFIFAGLLLFTFAPKKFIE